MHTNTKIALIEDDPDLQDMFNMKLKLEGYRAVCADNGADAIKLINKEKPDMILLDLLLPKMDGFEVLKSIRKSKDKKIRTTPVIVVTNLSSEEDVQEARKLGADEYLLKVRITPSIVIKKISKLFSKNKNNY